MATTFPHPRLMFNYGDTAESALDLLKEFGAELVITRFSGEYDPLTASKDRAVDVTGTFTMVVLNGKKSEARNNAFDNSYLEALRSGKVRSLLIAASGAPFEPTEGDFLTFAGASWRFRGVDLLAPAGVAVIYKAEVIKQ